MITVQAPQAARSQTFLAPVRSRWFLKASSNVTRGSRETVRSLPLMSRVIGTGPGPLTDAAGTARSNGEPESS